MPKWRITNQKELLACINNNVYLTEIWKKQDVNETLNSLLQYVNQLNTKYNDFPLFNLTITYEERNDTILNKEKEGHFSLASIAEIVLQRNHINISVNYQDFPLVSNVYVMTDWDDDERIGDQKFICYQYVYNTSPSKVLSHVKNNFNLVEHCYSIKQKITINPYKLMFKYVDRIWSDSFDPLRKLYSYYDKIEPINSHILLLNVTKNLLDHNLYLVIFIALDVFSANTFSQNKNFINLYETNTNSALQRLVMSNNNVPYLSKFGNRYTYYLYPYYGFNGLSCEPNDRAGPIIDYWTTSKKEEVLSTIYPSMLQARIMFDCMYFNHLYTFNNLSYQKKNQNISAIETLQYFKTNNSIDILDQATQNLDLSIGLKHGSDLNMFFTNEDLNEPIDITNNDATRYAHYHYLKNYYTSLKEYNVLFQTITYKDSTCNLFHTTLTLNACLKFVEMCYSKLNLFKNNQGTYDFETANTNLKSLKQNVNNNLNKLVDLCPSTTIYTRPSLLLDHKYFTQTTQTFLTLNPMLNPYLNHLKLEVASLAGDHTELKSYRYELVNQGVNYVQLNSRSSLVDIFISFVNEQKQAANSSLAGIFASYLFFLLYTHSFFTCYGFKSNKYGFLTPVVNFTGLMYGNLYLPNYKEQATAINNNDVANYADFYHKFVTIFLDIFTTTDFISQFSTYVNFPNLMNFKIPVELDYINDIIKAINDRSDIKISDIFNLPFDNLSKEQDMYKAYKMLAHENETNDLYRKLWFLQHRVIEDRSNQVLMIKEKDVRHNKFDSVSFIDVIYKFILQVVQKMQEIDPSFSLVPINDYTNMMKKAETKIMDMANKVSKKTDLLDIYTNYSNIKKGRL